MDEPAVVAQWRQRGEIVDVGGVDIFVVAHGLPATRAAVFLHGFPGSAHDWHGVLPVVAEHVPVLAPDLLGYGLSSKPDAAYSLFAQADLVTDLVVGNGIERAVIVAHDMGDTVAAELLARSTAGELPFAIERTILSNGSIFIDMAHLSAGQQFLLALPDERLASPLDLEGMRGGIEETLSPDRPPATEDVDALLYLIAHNGGDQLLPRIIRYIEERRANQDRWTAALVEHAAPLAALWGEQDPIAVLAMTDRLRDLRPSTEVVTWPDLSHWPSLEDPARVANEIVARL
jgi:pimeloyl-ACP methyl ester carboxylesterase